MPKQPTPTPVTQSGDCASYSPRHILKNAGIRASNVVFINGRRDPYSSVSLLPEQLSAAQTRLGVRSVAIANGSHCVGMEATSARDDPDVTAAKRAVREALAEWLGRPSLVS